MGLSPPRFAAEVAPSRLTGSLVVSGAVRGLYERVDLRVHGAFLWGHEPIVKELYNLTLGETDT